MPAISFVDALEILDSRGNPTLQVTVGLDNGIRGVAGVPSGASTGRHEAVELRDSEPDRYLGRGTLAAVGSVRRQINDLLRGHTVTNLADVLGIDQQVRELDGNPDYSRLGANAAVGVSMAVTRAAAACRELPVWELLADISAGSRGCRCRTSTWSTAARTLRTTWTSRSS